MCGRVCPQEDQCELHCVLGKKGKPINIGALERFAADINMGVTRSAGVRGEEKGPKVAVIGSGPAGLTCAADLARKGYEVTVLEALHKPGGVLVYGIPEFRLPKTIVEAEIEKIKKIGVKVKCNFIAGKTRTIDQLRKDGFKAFFIATGAGLPRFMGIHGENLNGVYSANEFLTRVNLMKAYGFPDYDTPVNVKGVVTVIGGGNVAMDSARCALRLGAEKVVVVYRRTKNEMPARKDEIEHAEEEGIELRMLTSPLEIESDGSGSVKTLKCIKNELGEPDSSGRRRPVPVPGSEFRMDSGTVIVAIGNNPNPVLIETLSELRLNKWGNIETDEDCRTNIPDIFAGGDIVTGSATVILAIGAGKKAARAIDEYLSA
jgi:glutamate synthase (NADPH/NADH) small chain